MGSICHWYIAKDSKEGLVQVGVPGVWVVPFVLRFQLWDRDRCVSHFLRSSICFCTDCIRPLVPPTDEESFLSVA